MTSAVQQFVERSVPFLIYGTAWKKGETARLVGEALRAGFRHIDTACQPKHYSEPGVGAGWTAAAAELGLSRADLYIQTKYTSMSGQDPARVPYDPSVSLEDQVRQSLAASLRNLRTEYLDGLVLHSPMRTAEDTLRVWRVFEDAVDAGTVRHLGVSNCYAPGQFATLYQAARVKPTVLQNRFYDDTGFDGELRAFCREHRVWYQSFWTLSANRAAIGSKSFRELANAKGLTPATLMYTFMLSFGYVTPLCGTTDMEHMNEDIAMMRRVQSGELKLTDAERSSIADLLGMPGL